MKRWAILVIMLGFLGGTVWSYPPRRPSHPVRWWQNPRIRERLALDAQQVQKLDDIYYKYMEEITMLRAELTRLRLQMERAMEAPEWETRQILEQARAVVNKRGELELKHVEMMLAIRKVLTPEQWQKLRELKRTVRRHMHRPRRPMRRPPSHETYRPRPPIKPSEPPPLQ